MARSEKPLRAVPRPVLLLLAAGLALQLAWHGLRPAPEASAQALPSAPPEVLLRGLSLGDPLVLAKTLMLWLQAFDHQPGISVPFRELDYGRVEAWLERILSLDPRGQYPLLAAARVYGEVADEERQRHMYAFVHRQFYQDPDRRWPWLAHAAILAKHRLEDLPLALEFARAITAHATGPGVPFWARDLSVLVLEEMGELEAARILIGGMLDSGEIQDAHQIRFLNQKLEELEEVERGRSAGSPGRL